MSIPTQPVAPRPHATGESVRRKPLRLVIVTVGFGAFFAVLFAQFPVAGRLPGNADTWFAIALSNTYASRLADLFGGGPPATALYPGGNPIQFGESSPGVALVYVAIRALGFDDVNAYYLLLCLLFTTTALAVFALARHYTGSDAAAVFAAVAFTCSNFTLANIDDCVIVFFGIAALAAWSFGRFLDRPDRVRPLYAAAVLGGLQVYFSAYVFLLLTIFLGVLMLDGAPILRGRAGGSTGTAPPRRHLLAACGLYLGLSAPFFGFYAATMRAQEFVTTRSFDLLVTSVGSLDPGDLVRALPGNLVHPPGAAYREADSARIASYLYDPETLRAAFENPDFHTLVRPYAAEGDEAFWISTRRRAHVGFLLYGLALVSLWYPNRRKRTLVVLFCVGLVTAFGPLITVGGTTIPTPLYPINRWIDFTNLFRVPSRAFFLSLVALSLLAAHAVAHWSRRLAGRHRHMARALPFLLGAALLVENVPVPLMSFAGRQYAEPGASLRGFFHGREAPPAVVLHLPSRTGFSYAGAGRDLYPLNREIIYMNWQTHLRQNTFNGVNGYLPRSRVEAQRLIDRLPDDAALDGLLALAGDGTPLYIAFHKDLVLPGEEALLPLLERSPRLRPVLRGETDLLFEVRP